MDRVLKRDRPLQRLGKRLDADYLVIGSITQAQNVYIVSTRLLSVATGEIVPGSSKTRTCRRTEDLPPTIDSLGLFIADQINRRTDLAREMNNRRASSATGR